GMLSAQIGTALGAFLLLFALAVGLAARSVLTRGRFGLGFGVTWQLFQTLVGASLLRGALYWQGGLALLLAIITFVLLIQLVRSTPLPGRDALGTSAALLGVGEGRGGGGAGRGPARDHGG